MKQLAMSKSTWIGVAAGIGVAVAGAATAYTYFGEPAAKEPNAARSGAHEECWDEEVATVADPKDPHRIAGTAVGAVVGGAVGKTWATGISLQLWAPPPAR